MSKIQTAVRKAQRKAGGLPGDDTDQFRALSDEGAQQDGEASNQQRGDITHRMKRGIRRLNTSELRQVAVDWELMKKNQIFMQDTDEQHPVQAAYRMLRTRLMQNMRTNNWRVLGISSIGENEGKTYTATNLAMCIAAEFGQEAILVDLDMRKPTIFKRLGVDPKDVTGLREYLDNESMQLAGLAISPGIDRLGLLLSTEPLDRSSDLLASNRGTELFAELRAQFSEDAIIIVDLPPLLAADDALAVAPMLDALLLVVAEGQAQRRDVAEASHMLDSFNVIGTVLNKSVEKDSKRPGYY